MWVEKSQRPECPISSHFHQLSLRPTTQKCLIFSSSIKTSPTSPLKPRIRSRRSGSPLSAQFLRGGPYNPALAAIIPVDRLRDDEKITGRNLRKNYAQRTSYFRNPSVRCRWFREYMLKPRLAQTRKGAGRGIKKGDVCLLREDNQPRIRWRLVRILYCLNGCDW